tara:strand:- start:620 stop:1114 length:495 start_codon:yes stop_codon:yes gene_type:complete
MFQKILNILKWPFSYWFNFLLEFRLWLSFRKVTKGKKNELQLEEAGLRVDWLGRVYGVINIPDEVLGAAEQIQQAYVLKEMGRFGDVMNKLKLSNVVYPQMQEIEGAGAYLVIFWPVLDRLNWINIIGSILGTLLYGFIVFFTVKLFIYYGVVSSITDWISGII